MLPPGTRWADIPDDWVCPSCGAAKIRFRYGRKLVLPPNGTLTLEVPGIFRVRGFIPNGGNLARPTRFEQCAFGGQNGSFRP
ncbi:rubredoxin [Bradyrhizobium genosp. P]|uniref:rubredoxin n=1 Tax=Bradyrhizobium genosp. P TaxID=83641 RepID=UPI003CE7C933